MKCRGHVGLLSPLGSRQGRGKQQERRNSTATGRTSKTRWRGDCEHSGRPGSRAQACLSWWPEVPKEWLCFCFLSGGFLCKCPRWKASSKDNCSDRANGAKLSLPFSLAAQIHVFQCESTVRLLPVCSVSGHCGSSPSLKEFKKLCF